MAKRTNIVLAEDVSRRTRLGKPWHTSTISHGRCLQVVERFKRKQHELIVMSVASRSAVLSVLDINAEQQHYFAAVHINIHIHLLVCLAPILISPLCCLSRLLGFTVHLHSRRVGQYQSRSRIKRRYCEVLDNAFY